MTIKQILVDIAMNEPKINSQAFILCRDNRLDYEKKVKTQAITMTSKE